VVCILNKLNMLGSRNTGYNLLIKNPTMRLESVHMLEIATNDNSARILIKTVSRR